MVTIVWRGGLLNLDGAFSSQDPKWHFLSPTWYIQYVQTVNLWYRFCRHVQHTFRIFYFEIYRRTECSA